MLDFDLKLLQNNFDCDEVSVYLYAKRSCLQKTKSVNNMKFDIKCVDNAMNID